MKPYELDHRRIETTIGELINSVYEEVGSLPLSNQTKSALVMLMVGEMLQRDGHKISLKRSHVQLPTELYTGLNDLELAVQAH